MALFAFSPLPNSHIFIHIHFRQFCKEHTSTASVRDISIILKNLYSFLPLLFKALQIKHLNYKGTEEL